MDELGAYPRRLILALGNSAVRSITDKPDLKITQVRGRIIDTPLGPVLPILHPAAILRNTKDYATFQEDFNYAGTIINNGNSAIRNPGEPEWVVATPEDVHDHLRRLAGYSVLGADIETTGFNAHADRILCLGIAYERNKVVIFPEEILDEYGPQVAHLLSDPDIRWVWHNGKFDTTFLQQHELPGVVDEDTMLLSYALDERGGVHDLKQLAANLLGTPDYEHAIKAYLPNKATSFEAIPRPVLWKYLAYDCDSTLQTFHQLRSKVEADPALNQLYTKVLVPASRFLQTVEREGIWVNPVALRQLDRDLDDAVLAAESALDAAVEPYWDVDTYMNQTGAVKKPEMFSPGSPKQLQWLLYSRFGLNLRPPKGFQANTREDTITRLRGRPEANLVIDTLLEYREVRKAKGTYSEGIAKRLATSPDARVHATFLLHGTTTGRLSSRDPNLQNIPRPGSGAWSTRIRDIFQAPPGRRLVELDYSQAELRVLAHLSADPFLTQVYNEGRDLHDEVAREFFPGWDDEPDPYVKKEQRIRAKFVNFGIAYGRGPESIDKEFGSGIAEARRFIDLWFRRAAKAGEYIMACRAVAARGGVLTTPIGRKRRFHLVTRETRNTLENEAANFPIQSTASDLTLLSAMAMAHNDVFVELGARVVNLVHDSILIECNDRDEDVMRIVEAAVAIMQATPVRVLKSTVMFAADAKVGYSWGSLKDYNHLAHT